MMVCLKKALAAGPALIAAATILSCHGPARKSAAGFENAPTPAAQPTANAANERGVGSARAVRTLRFSGYDWTVKSSDRRVGPGPNYFSDGDDNVSVDAEGRLHLRITRRDGRWLCAEVVSAQSFGYGTYRFYLGDAVDGLDPQVVLGMFTWNDDPAYNHREIDMEISRWGRADNENGQFVVQPYSRPRNVARFQIPSGVRSSTHFFTWSPDAILCRSLRGRDPASSEAGLVIQQHTFTQDIPRAGGENARINLWLLAGRPPSDGEETEVVISKFEFVKQ